MNEIQYLLLWRNKLMDSVLERETWVIKTGELALRLLSDDCCGVWTDTDYHVRRLLAHYLSLELYT